MHKLNIKTMVLGPISTNTYICTVSEETAPDMPTGCFIVDPASNAPAIIEALGAITPSSILLTHGHFDHLMAVNDLKERYPDIKVYAHPADSDIMLHPGRNIVRKEFTAQAISEFEPVEDGQVLEIEGAHIEVISTPGHTDGGVCYYLKDQKVMFSGDTIFMESYGRTDFEHGDFDKLRDSIINKIFEKLKDEGHVDILPGHMDPTTLEHEMKYNPILS